MRGVFCLLLFLLATLRAGAATAVWIDTDIAIGAPWREVDDAFALGFALQSPELRIVGISTTFGNASLQRTTSVARDFARRFCPDIGVFSGATEANAALASALEKEPLTYVALGPLTNLASFVAQNPAQARRIERVIFVGGRSPGRALAFGPTGAMRIHDANVFKDSDAVARILRTKIPLVLAPIETSSHLLLRPNERRELRGPLGNFLRERTLVWMWFWTGMVREPGGPLFDLLPMLDLVRPQFLRSEKRFAALDAHGDLIATHERNHNARVVLFCTGFAGDPMALVRQRISGARNKRSPADSGNLPGHGQKN